LEGEKYQDRTGERSVIMKPPHGAAFVFAPSPYYLQWAVEVGGADVECMTKNGCTTLEWLFDWFNPDEDNWHMVYYKQSILSTINYLFQANVGSVVDPNQVIEMLNQSYVT